MCLGLWKVGCAGPVALFERDGITHTAAQAMGAYVNKYKVFEGIEPVETTHHV